jgi:hypothetical protein
MVKLVNVVSICPLPVASIIWQPRAGLYALTVIVKGTYRLTPGVSTFAEPQDEICEYDNYWDDDTARSLYSPSDLVPFKPRADVLLVGYAFAPRREPARHVIARLVVAGIDKAIEVWADRTLAPDGSIREGGPFVKMPLRYERAAAGPTNPVGTSAEARAESAGGIVHPNLQPHGQRITGRNARIESIGFGPIAPSWPARAARLAQPTANFAADWSDKPIPNGLDPSYFNAAPPDQQVDRLRPDEPILLENLHPEHSKLETVLPGLLPRVMIEHNGTSEELRMTPDTLRIDTGRGLCSLVWRGQVRLERPDEPERVVVTMKQAGQTGVAGVIAEAVPPKSAPTQPAAAQPRSYMLITSDLDVAAATITSPLTGTIDPALPFVPSGQMSSALPTWQPLQREQRDASRDAGETMMTGFGSLPQPPLPFGGAAVPRVATPPDQAPLRQNESPPIAPFTAPQWGAPQPLPSPVPSMSRGSVGQSVTGATASEASRASDGTTVPVFTTSGAAISSPAEDAVGYQPRIASIAALREVGLVPDVSAMSAFGLSNAAASPEMRVTKLEAPLTPNAVSSPRRSTPIELLWFDQTFVERIRKAPRLASTLAEEQAARRAKEKQDKKLRAKSASDAAPAPDERTDIETILASGEANGVETLSLALAEAVNERGVFTAPIMLVEGTLDLPFDEMETLKATVAAVAPLAAGDKKLNEMMGTIVDLLRTPWLQASGSGSERLTKEIKEAFTTASRLVPAGYLETQTERLLLEQRHYQKRHLLGQPWIRALFTSPGSSGRIPSYLPQSLARELPMFQRFAARLIVEVRTQLDQYETSPIALRVLAFGRLLSGLPLR